MKTYFEWERMGQYNSSKSNAAWKYSHKQTIEALKKIKIDLKKLYVDRELGDGDMDLMQKDALNKIIKACEEEADKQLQESLEELLEKV